MRLMLLAVLLAFAAGCGKKAPPAEPAEEPKPTDTTAYAIKTFDRQGVAGEKWLVHRKKDATTTVTIKGSSQVKEETEEEDFTEAVATPKDKFTRAYRVARRTKNGKSKSLPHEGQTVTIERKGDLFSMTMNGRQLTRNEAPDLYSEFDKDDESDRSAMLPKTAVKINEVWEVDRDVIRKKARRSTESIDPEKSKLTGKLLKAYTSAGKQWGVIEWTLVMVFSGPQKKGMPDRVTMTITLEGPIDGSKGEIKRTRRASLTLEEETPDGTVKAKSDHTDVETIRPQQ
jgi:hypothetical protein